MPASFSILIIGAAARFGNREWDQFPLKRATTLYVRDLTWSSRRLSYLDSFVNNDLRVFRVRRRRDRRKERQIDRCRIVTYRQTLFVYSTRVSYVLTEGLVG